MEGATIDTEQDVPGGAIAEEELERKRKGYCSNLGSSGESNSAYIVDCLCLGDLIATFADL